MRPHLLLWRAVCIAYLVYFHVFRLDSLWQKVGYLIFSALVLLGLALLKDLRTDDVIFFDSSKKPDELDNVPEFVIEGQIDADELESMLEDSNEPVTPSDSQ